MVAGTANAAIAASKNILRRETICDLIGSLMAIPLTYVPLGDNSY
jgi:hypothetical protein